MTINNPLPTAPKSCELMIVDQPYDIVIEFNEWRVAAHKANALHHQISAIGDQIQGLEQRRWMTAVVLGCFLTQTKARSQFGEWKLLFSKSDTCVTFEYRTAARYMKLFKEVLKRATRLKDNSVDIALIAAGNRDAKTYAEIAKLSDADTLRQAYLDFNVIRERDRTDSPNSQFTASGNPAGRPKKDAENTDPEAEAEEARQLASYAASEITRELMAFIDQGRHALLATTELSAIESTLRHATRELHAARTKMENTPLAMEAPDLSEIDVSDISVFN